MRPHLALTLLLLASANYSDAQTIYSKDGRSLGDRMEFINSCTEAAGAELLHVAGMRMDAAHYCRCMCDELMPQVPYAELDAAITNGSIESLLLDDRYIDKFKECALATAEFDDSLELADLKLDGPAGAMYMKECVSSAMISLGTEEAAMRLLVEQYCTCTLERIQVAGLTWGDLQQLGDMESMAFKDVVAPCLYVFE
ncbi:MAG: hypothetical protein KF905_05835 [Flavobacteriales bacterium]|nr:hypothetical protein [Flavobacteriales bacterium]